MPPSPFHLDVDDGHRIAGDRQHGAAPGYLFLHGLGAGRLGEKSESLLAHATAHGRAFARFDFRGHGDSTGTIGQVTVSELIADAIAVLEHLGPAIVVGSSLGGLVGAFAAARRPELVAGLGLLAPAFGFLTALDRALDARGRLWTTDGRSFPVASEVLADARTHDEEALPDRLLMPVFVVHGDHDEVVPSARSARFCSELPHASHDLWIVAGADHSLDVVTDRIWPRLDRVLLPAGA